MRTPEFWYPVHGRSSGPLPWLLAPFAICYMFAGWLRQRFSHPYRAPIPVICVGNLTVGGTGKTPVALALAVRLLGKGIQVHFITRGHGGNIAGPVRVDPEHHNAANMGDEALLLARAAPCWVSRNRKAGAIAAVAAGAKLLILDDGHQNPHLVKDLSIVLIDAERGFGNGWVIPCGPLREPVARGLARANAVLIMGNGGNFPDFGKTQLRAHRQLSNPDSLRNQRLFAFCGIGAPQQFFDMLRQAGAGLAGVQAFPDHHPFTDNEIDQIISSAEKTGATPVTTEKDWVRLPPPMRRKILAVGMEIRFSDEPALARLLETVIHKPA